MNRSVQNLDDAVAPGLADQRGDEGEADLDHLRLEINGGAGEALVLEVQGDLVFDLIEPTGTSRYDEALKRGPRQLLKRDLDRKIDEHVAVLVRHYGSSLGETHLRSIVEKIVMANWKVRP